MTFAKKIRCAAIAVAVTAAVGVSADAAVASTPPDRAGITEYYHGMSYPFSPSDWRGATDCAVKSKTAVFCFDTADQLNAWTAEDEAATRRPLTTVSPNTAQGYNCTGWTKIWNGPNWTNRGLAFSDWGYAMDINSYYTGTFVTESWFSDAQRGYNTPNSCNARIFKGTGGTGTNILLPANAHSLSMSFSPTESIELYKP